MRQLMILASLLGRCCGVSLSLSTKSRAQARETPDETITTTISICKGKSNRVHGRQYSTSSYPMLNKDDDDDDDDDDIDGCNRHRHQYPSDFPLVDIFTGKY